MQQPERRTFHIPNWEELQHYKDRSPPWIKLYTRLLENYGFASLPDHCKAHLIGIWLLASRSNNELPYDSEWIGKRINATQKVELDLLMALEFIVLDQPLQQPAQTASKPQAECLPRDRAEAEREAEGESAGQIAALFDPWWEKFPRHRRGSKGPACRKWISIIKRGKATADDLNTGLDRYLAAGYAQSKFACGAERWLNDERWTVETWATPGDLSVAARKPTQKGAGVMDAFVDIAEKAHGE
jgi:hypothetical protein